MAPPPLVVVISVDQLSGDLWDEYRPHFTGGLARIGSGIVFRNGYQSHAATETCPGHSTVLTGVRPSGTGIIANAWFDSGAPRDDKTVYCAEDESAAGSTSRDYKVSPIHLRVPTLGDIVKQRSPSSLNVAVAGKDRSAVMMGGRTVDQRWYPSGSAFVTDQAGAPVPASVVRTNAYIKQRLSESQPPLVPPPACASKSQVFSIAGGGKPVGGGAFARAAGDNGAFRASPEFDATVLALAAALIDELRLGRDMAPDILSIGLAGSDYVGHTYGPGGQEMCLQLLSLDRDLGDFFRLLDGWGLDYVVALTADHGVLDIPERLRARGVAGAAWLDPALTVERMNEQIARAANLKGPVLVAGGPSGDVYVDRSLARADRRRATAAAIAAYRAHPQVEAAFTKAELARQDPPQGPPDGWTLLQRIRASFDAQRSGDIYVVLKPNVQPIVDTRSYVATHGSPWDYDRRVPIMFWRRGMRSAPNDSAIETVDIMPTLAAMLGVSVDPKNLDGECLAGVPGVVCRNP